VNSILLAGRAHLCAIGRTHLYDPHWTLHAAAEQEYRGDAADWPVPFRAGSRKPPSARTDAIRPRLSLLRPAMNSSPFMRIARRLRPLNLGCKERARTWSRTGRYPQVLGTAGLPGVARRLSPRQWPPATTQCHGRCRSEPEMAISTDRRPGPLS